MELWQVRKQYRALASSVRRMGASLPAEVSALEGELLAVLLLCDRLETEQSFLRFAKRGARSRLKRVRRWAELAGFMKAYCAPLIRRDLEDSLDALARGFEQRGVPAVALRQALAEATSLDRRCEELRARLAHASVVAGQHLRQLASWVRAYRQPAVSGPSTPLEGDPLGG